MKSAFQENIENLPEGLYSVSGGPRYRVLLGYLSAKTAYYKGEPIISDSEFDKLENHIYYEFPDCPVLEVVGEPTEKDFADLWEWYSTYGEEEE